MIIGWGVNSACSFGDILSIIQKPQEFLNEKYPDFIKSMNLITIFFKLFFLAN